MPTTNPSVPIKALVMRATRLDACGNPICGPLNSVVSKGFIEVNLSPEIDTGVDFTTKLSDGSYCVNQKDCDTLKWFDLELKMCGVDPALLELIADDPPVLDYSGNQTGFRHSDQGCGTNFAFEVWTKLAGAACVGSSASAIWGYLLLPGATNMQLEEIDLGNKTVDFSIKGNTFKNPQWCRGPYNVTAQVATGHPAGVLLTPIDATDHFHYEAVTVAPPTPAAGYTAVPCTGSGTTPGSIAVPVPCV